MPDPRTLSCRPEAACARRVVVKVGSAALGSRLESVADNVSLLAKEIGEQNGQHRDLVIVASGAVAIGRMLLVPRHTDAVTMRELAAVGQAWLTARFRDAFDFLGVRVAQLLLDELATRPPAHSVAATIDGLLRRGCVPVINENDSGADMLIGNNDLLAARIAGELQADLLVFLSDVPGVREQPGECVLARIATPAQLGSLPVLASPQASPGTGGMPAKLAAASHAADRGIPVLIGALGDLTAMLAGRPVGTLVAWDPSTRPALRTYVPRG